MASTFNETQSGTTLNCAVAIVGCGPTGLVAAALLGQAGQRVVVVERWPEPYGLPRLTHIDGETARLVQSCSDVDAALRDAMPVLQYQFRDADGNLLLGTDWREEQCGFPSHISIFQPDIEEAICARATSFPNVTILRGMEATQVAPDNDGVTLVARPWTQDGSADGPGITLRASYLIGADGANSFIRRTLGIGRKEYEGNERWLNLDSEIRRDLGGRFEISTIHCDPARAHMFMPIGKSRVRFELRLLPGEEIDYWENLDNAWAWLKGQHGLGPDDIKPIRNVVYTFSPAIAEKWSNGRIFLGGDAAHTMMPYMGQGACSGMRDGANLAWKLDLVLRGLCDPALLDTYEIERRPHVTHITEVAQFLGKVANEDDLEKVAARNAMFLSGKAPPMPPFPKIEDGIVHREPDGTLAPTTGAPPPQGIVRNNGREGRLDDLAGGGFMLVCREAPDAFLNPSIAQFIAQLGCKVVTLSDTDYVDIGGDQTAFLDHHGMAAYMRRPDLAVFGSVAQMESLNGLLADLREKLYWRAKSAPDVGEGSAVETAA